MTDARARDPATPHGEPVQRSVGPSVDVCSDEPLYFRGDRARFDHASRAWEVSRGGWLSFDAYFNGLSIKRWRETAPLADLHVDVVLEGRAALRLHRMQVGPIASLVAETTIDGDGTPFRWSVDAWSRFDDGILYLAVHPIDERCVLRAFTFGTTTPALRPVKLGICITHFDRKRQIVPAIARLKRELLDDPAYAARVGLVVVDNSRDLDRAETAGATLLANRNLGGAGGFARGMMFLRDEGSFTHALFMDDDASCEVESIRRSIDLLAHATDARTAVSGAMLRELEPYRQFERGARFDGVCRPMRGGVDLRDRGVLAWNEREQSADYGGWWFFAFPLDGAVGYPYPYFVRGDDVDFALRNRFPIVHANGIASWQEDFAFKHGPQTQYLDARSHLMHVLHGLGGGRLRALALSLRLFLLSNLAGQYEQAAAAVMAMRDVRRGPDFFRAHADLAEPRRRLQAATRAERMLPLDASALRDAEWTTASESRGARLLRLATLNGHLVPRAFFHRRPARFGKEFVLPLRGTFLRRTVVVCDEFSGKGMVLAHSKRRFFRNLASYLRQAFGLATEFDLLARAYRRAYPELTSEGFWRRQFAMPAEPPPVATRTGAPFATAAGETSRAR